MEVSGAGQALDNVESGVSGPVTPQIWVVSVCKDDPTGLSSTRRSLLEQSYTGWRHVVVLAETNGPIAEMALAWESDGRTKVVLGANRGVYSAMNAGLQHTTVGYVQFLNAGDVYATTHSLSVMASEVAGRAWGFGPIVEVDARGRERVWADAQFSASALSKQTIRICHQSVLMDVEALPSSAIFDATKSVSADYGVLLALADLQEPVQWSQPVVRFRAGGISYVHPWRALWECHECRRARAQGAVDVVNAWRTMGRLSTKLAAGQLARRMGIRGR